MKRSNMMVAGLMAAGVVLAAPVFIITKSDGSELKVTETEMAIEGSGENGFSVGGVGVDEIRSVRRAPEVLAKPVVTVKDVTYSAVGIGWEAVDGASGYQVSAYRGGTEVASEMLGADVDTLNIRGFGA